MKLRKAAALTISILAFSVLLWATVFGLQSHDAQDASDNNFMLAIPLVTDSSSYTVDATASCSSWFMATGGGLGQCAIYDHDGANNRPGNLLCSSASVSLVSNGSHATNNWTQATLSGCGTLAASTKYWIVWNNNAATAEPGYQSAGTYCTGIQSAVFKSQTFGTWPNPFGATGGTTVCFTQWINATASGGGGAPKRLTLLAAG